MAHAIPCLLALLLLSAPTAFAEGAGTANDADHPEAQGTVRIAFSAREWLDLDLDAHGVRVDRIKLHQPGKVKSLFTKHEEANRGRVVITNGTDRNVHPAVAIAVFDDEGRLLACANTGKKVFAVKPGVTKELEIHFGGVFRHLERGAWIYVTLEY